MHHAPFALPEARTGFATTLRGTVDPLGRFAMVVFQQATESITAFDVASNKADFIAGMPVRGPVDLGGAERFLELMAELGGEDLVGQATTVPDGLFADVQ